MSGSKVVLYTNPETVKQTVTVPNLIGYTLTEAIETLTDLGLNVQGEQYRRSHLSEYSGWNGRK